MRSIVHNRQSLVDFAVQECGSFEAAFALAERNGISITDPLTSGTELEYSLKNRTNIQVVETLKIQRLKPATAISSSDEAIVPCGGIGFMGIEVNFIIS